MKLKKKINFKKETKGKKTIKKVRVKSQIKIKWLGIDWKHMFFKITIKRIKIEFDINNKKNKILKINFKTNKKQSN
jgi:hypothetical protein